MAEGSKPRKSTPRRRLPADEARERILQAAERKLAQVGPEGLRLTDLAAELGISHPAILHHFGKREDLVAEVVTHAIARFNARLIQALEGNIRRREAILDMIGEFFAAEGTARTLAWLVLSGRAGKQRGRTIGTASRPLKNVIDMVHAQRVQAYPERTIDPEDSKFRSHLTVFALLGEALFGNLIRFASDEPTGAEQSREFRRRLAQLLADYP